MLDRANAGIQVELLAQRNVQRAKAAAHRGGQGSLDGYDQIFKGLQGFRRKVVAVVDPAGLLAHVDLAPVDLALAVVGLLDRRVPDAQAGVGDVGADAVAFDIAQYRIVRNGEPAILDGDFFSPFRDNDVLIAHDGSSTDRYTGKSTN